jgi:hypothetical protein
MLGAFATWAPRLFQYYAKYRKDLYQKYPNLKRNFPHSIWTTSTFNLGPRTICFDHCDQGNLAFGWCAITALGDFDYRRGGHLILWDLKLVIEFPPGSTILIPSAVFRHSNVTIAPGDSRMSFTQYTSGGLFRWVDCRFHTLSSFRKDCRNRDAYAQASKTRWQMGLDLFSRVDDLISTGTCSE